MLEIGLKTMGTTLASSVMYVDSVFAFNPTFYQDARYKSYLNIVIYYLHIEFGFHLDELY